MGTWVPMSASMTSALVSIGPRDAAGVVQPCAIPSSKVSVSR
ncbi:hypothetical protein [Paracoccus benzoatiresistens]|uniref:Uncharacterized protein n=1 Tax=Paracoccus benzoatiresistens TaxID=2997341 RepID=A0ABT4J5X7_9RHOB|nr:hypothetical protein [Paracoccus sp. EF6]MCZ0962524.1 hypothetical protein [Paracoccus sp. EF6]